MRRLPRTLVLGSVSSARNAMRTRAPQGLAGDHRRLRVHRASRAQRETVAVCREWRGRIHRGSDSARHLQAQRLASGNRAQRDAAAYGSALDDRERVVVGRLKFKLREAPSAQSQAPRPSAG